MPQLVDVAAFATFLSNERITIERIWKYCRRLLKVLPGFTITESVALPPPLENVLAQIVEMCEYQQARSKRLGSEDLPRGESRAGRRPEEDAWWVEERDMFNAIGNAVCLYFFRYSFRWRELWGLSPVPKATKGGNGNGVETRWVNKFLKQAGLPIRVIRGSDPGVAAALFEWRCSILRVVKMSGWAQPPPPPVVIASEALNVAVANALMASPPLTYQALVYCDNAQTPLGPSLEALCTKTSYTQLEDACTKEEKEAICSNEDLLVDWQNFLTSQDSTVQDTATHPHTATVTHRARLIKHYPNFTPGRGTGAGSSCRNGHSWSSVVQATTTPRCFVWRQQYCCLRSRPSAGHCHDSNLYTDHGRHDTHFWLSPAQGKR